MMMRGVILFVCRVCWDVFMMGVVMLWVMEVLIMLVLVLVFKVSLSEW